MFFSSDIYTSYGNTKLYHCWTDKVTKYDSSSFYNWEQDNLPIYDLDERTHYLWEQLGYPTSAVPGVALVVSADASDTDIACNKSVFRSLSAAIEAIPQSINYPIIIEVASFGDLGDLVLSNRRFGPNGSLEIINRNFAKQECSVSNAASVSAGVPGVFPHIVGKIDSTNDPFSRGGAFHGYLSSVVTGVSFDTSNGNSSPLKGFLQASCMSLSAPVFSSTTDSRLSGTGAVGTIKLNAFISSQKFFDNFKKSTVVIDSFNTLNPYITGDPYGMQFKAYDLISHSSEDIFNKDIETLNLTRLSSIPKVFNGGEKYNGWQGFVATSGYNGLYYGNKLNKIFVNNCDGKIFIRNFFLHGGGSQSTGNNNGVEVNNSPNILLENIVVARYRKAGFKFTNSNVVITRGCAAYRIYDFDATGARLTRPNLFGIAYPAFNATSGYPLIDNGAGIVANNSTITFSSTHEIESTLYQSRWGQSNKPFIGNYCIFEFTRNANGMILNNSIVQGGKIQDSTQVYPTLSEMYFDFDHNVGHGIISNNSKISLDGRLRLIGNSLGASINNSVLELDKLTCLSNQLQAIEAFNSKITYNKNSNIFHVGGNLLDDYTYPYHFENNGQNLLLNNSTFTPVYTSSMEEKYARILFKNPVGIQLGAAETTNVGLLESVKLKNNSESVFISPFFYRDVGHSREADQITNPYYSKKGTELLVENNSKAILKGTKYFATKAVGPESVSYSRNYAGLAAENNSTIQIVGPTVIAQFGIDLIADNRSKILLSTNRENLDNSIDLSSINLNDTANHTMVELHATKACIVADNNSMIEARDLGSFYDTWGLDGSKETSSLYTSGLDYLATIEILRPYIKGGSLQFYPNPSPPTFKGTGGDYIDLASSPNFTQVYGVEAIDPNIMTGGSLLTKEAFDYASSKYSFLHPLNPSYSKLYFSSVTMGGVCVKAVNNSFVNIQNVNFPCGFWNPSAPIFDAFVSPLNCPEYKLFVWNICDTSKLKASYLSVSGLHPSLNQYYTGPSGIWTSGAGAIASGLPSSTPDTSSMSILDFYGANPSASIIPFTTSSVKNYGPFRLYFSVDPAVNTLTTTSGTGQGTISQIYSQGYQPSANLICSGQFKNFIPSSIYKYLIQKNTNGNLVPSGYYYGKDMLAYDSIRVNLDEISADVFANARHCSTGRSNNARLVSLFYPIVINEAGSGKFGDSYPTGLGSVNLFDIQRD